jgi:hypothetical protein
VASIYLPFGVKDSGGLSGPPLIFILMPPQSKAFPLFPALTLTHAYTIP